MFHNRLNWTRGAQRQLPQAIVCEPIRKRRDPIIAEIERLAESLEPGIRRAVLAALNAQMEAVDLAALASALQSGSTANVMAVLDAATTPASMTLVQRAVLDGVTGAGIATAVSISRITRAEFSFGVLNPALIDWLQTYSFGLIREINDNTREGVRAAVMDGIKTGSNPVYTARQIKQLVGLTAKQAKAVTNYRKELETFHQRRSAKGFGLGNQIDRANGRQVFKPDEKGAPKDGILQRRLRDFRHDKALQRAMETGKALTPAQIDKMVESYATKYRRYRSETIAITEASRVMVMGVQDAWRQAITTGKVDEALVRRQWILAEDERLCSDCSPVPRMNPKRGVKFNEAFQTPKGPVFLPGLHPRCRCKVFIRMWEAKQLQDKG